MYKRVVLKIGTKVLANEEGGLDREFLAHVAQQIIALRTRGVQVVLVSSGAVGAGRNVIRVHDIVSETVQKQVFAAVGQVQLMRTYCELFAEHGYHCAQVLATKEDFRDDVHYRNMQNCFEGLLLDSVIPIVNENDVVATTELLFTDNDELAGLVAEQLGADSLIILTSTNGILDEHKNTIPIVDETNFERVQSFITPAKSTGGRGGMVSKFAVARGLSQKGIAVHIVDGKRKNVLQDVINEEKAGTTFLPRL